MPKRTKDGFSINNSQVNFQSQQSSDQDDGSLSSSSGGDDGSQNGIGLEEERLEFQDSLSESQSSTVLTQPVNQNQTAQYPGLPKPPRCSNIDFKKCYSLLRKYRRKHKLPQNPYQKKHYGNKSYFFLTILFIEKQGKLEQCLRFYKENIQGLIRKQSGQTLLSLSVIEYCKIAQKAFQLYVEGKTEQAFKTFYKYDAMRHKHYFNAAWKFFKEESKQKGLFYNGTKAVKTKPISKESKTSLKRQTKKKVK